MLFRSLGRTGLQHLGLPSLSTAVPSKPVQPLGMTPRDEVTLQPGLCGARGSRTWPKMTGAELCVRRQPWHRWASGAAVHTPSRESYQEDWITDTHRCPGRGDCDYRGLQLPAAPCPQPHGPELQGAEFQPSQSRAGRGSEWSSSAIMTQGLCTGCGCLSSSGLLGHLAQARTVTAPETPIHSPACCILTVLTLRKVPGGMLQEEAFGPLGSRPQMVWFQARLPAGKEAGPKGFR